jgi:hypothetical protein
MAAALKDFNTSYADERVQVNGPSAWRKPLVATKPMDMRELIRGHH